MLTVKNNPPRYAIAVPVVNVNTTVFSTINKVKYCLCWCIKVISNRITIVSGQ